MFCNHLFWITLALLFCSAMNINAYFEFSGSSKTLRRSIGVMGVLGLIAGFIRFIILSIEYNWWWMVVGMGTFLISVGILSYLFRHKIRDLFGILNFIIIPFFWWYGSPFNTVLSTDWFYDLLEAITKFFA